MHKCKCISVKWMYEMHKSHESQTALAYLWCFNQISSVTVCNWVITDYISSGLHNQITQVKYL